MARIFVDCTLFGRETSMNGQRCGLKGPREVERVCLDFFSVLWREQCESNVLPGWETRSQSCGKVWKHGESWWEGEYGFAGSYGCRKGWNNFGMHPKEPEKSSDHPSREPAPPEINHQLGILGNLNWFQTVNVGTIRHEAYEKVSVIFHGLSIQTWRWCLSPFSPGCIPPHQHLPFPCVGLASQHTSDLWKSPGVNSWLNAQGRLPVIDMLFLTCLNEVPVSLAACINDTQYYTHRMKFEVNN